MKEDSVRKKMQEVIGLVITDISSIRTGKATPALVEELSVSVYGGQQEMKVNELATISTTDAQTLIIEPWDKSIIGEIKKGIESANIGMNPSIDGEIIRITLPPLTTEDREKYIKLLSSKLESGKVMIRQVRRDALKEIRVQYEDKQVSEDEKFNQEKKLQDITDEYVGKIDEAGETKKKELLQI